MMVHEGGMLVCIASGLWRGAGPSFACNPGSDEKHSKDVTPVDNSMRKIKWKRPANPEQLITLTSTIATGKNTRNGNNNRNASQSKDNGPAYATSYPLIQSTGSKGGNELVQNGTSVNSDEKSKNSPSSVEETSHNNDLYNLPLSPILPRKAHSLASKSESLKACSPEKHARRPGLNAQKKRSNQKRVPKRSILDSPEESKPTMKVAKPSALHHETETFRPNQSSEDLSVASTLGMSMQTAYITETKKQTSSKRVFPPIVISSESEKTSEKDEYSEEASCFMPHVPSSLIGNGPLRGSSTVNKKKQGTHLSKAQAQNVLKNRPGPDQSTVRRGLVGALPENSRQESSRKRKLSPTSRARNVEVEKRLKVDSVQMPDKGDETIPALRRNRGNLKQLHVLPIVDPFSGHENFDSMAPTEFTAKLLNTACQAENSENMHEHDRSAPISFEHKKDTGVDRQVGRETNDIARQVMQAFQVAEPQQPSSINQESYNETTRDAWLDGSDPYSGTRNVMGYVCKTILRFLKSKESAIEDVATEYFQRGSVVIKNIEVLHNEERVNVYQKFEACRLGSIRLYETAHQDICMSAGKLGSINLAPVVSEVLANSVTARLHALRDEVM